MKVGDQSAAGRGAATARHGPVLLAHRCGIIKQDLFAGGDRPQRKSADEIAQPCIRFARVVREGSWRLEINIGRRRNLQDLPSRFALGDGLRQSDDRPGETKKQIAGREVPSRKNARATHALSNVNTVSPRIIPTHKSAPTAQERQPRRRDRQSDYARLVGTSDQSNNHAYPTHRNKFLTPDYVTLGSFSAAIRTNVVTIRNPATNVPRKVPDTFDSPPARRL
jgi:hypothetical protein